MAMYHVMVQKDKVHSPCLLQNVMLAWARLGGGIIVKNRLKEYLSNN